ncbi:MAG: acyl-CoA thioesterase [Planctomycetes bacterium]|nr:acyl-CoA thioesterase [Planctomycetota bacterium]
MSNPQHSLEFRVRYSETDQMRTYYNSRALEWFERGRTEMLRAMGKPYREMERLGVLLPVTEAHVEFLGRAEYDDLLKMTSTLSRAGKARVRVDVEIEHADGGQPVCRGYTVHAVTNAVGKPIRPPEWFGELVC